MQHYPNQEVGYPTLDQISKWICFAIVFSPLVIGVLFYLDTPAAPERLIEVSKKVSATNWYSCSNYSNLFISEPQTFIAKKISYGFPVSKLEIYFINSFADSCSQQTVKIADREYEADIQRKALASASSK